MVLASCLLLMFPSVRLPRRGTDATPRASLPSVLPSEPKLSSDGVIRPLHSMLEELGRGDHDTLLRQLLEAAILPADLPIGAQDETLLHRAAEANQRATTELLLAHKASVLTANRVGDTAMHLAAREASMSVIEGFFRSSDQMRLRAANEALGCKNRMGLTPLQCVSAEKKSATAQRAKAVRRFLLERTTRRETTRDATATTSAPSGGSKGRYAMPVPSTASTLISGQPAPTTLPPLPSPTDVGSASAQTTSPSASSPKAVSPEAAAAATKASEAASVQAAGAPTLLVLHKHITAGSVASLHNTLAAALATPVPAIPGVAAPLRHASALAGEAVGSPAVARSAATSTIAQGQRRAMGEVGPSFVEVGPRAVGDLCSTATEVDLVVETLEANRLHASDDDDAAGPEFKFELCAWRVVIVRNAAKQLNALDGNDCTAALSKLYHLAEGFWQGATVAKKLVSHAAGARLSLYESKFLKGARIIWEVGVDFSPSVGMVITAHLPTSTTHLLDPLYFDMTYSRATERDSHVSSTRRQFVCGRLSARTTALPRLSNTSQTYTGVGSSL